VAAATRHVEAPISAAAPIAVLAITFDFGNTLVRVDRVSLRVVVETMGERLHWAGTIDDVDAFLAAWSEERERQFREEVPALREVDLAERVVRVLARGRGMSPPADDVRWDDVAAAGLVDPDEVATAVGCYSEAFVATVPPDPEAGPTIAALAAAGYRLGIVSNWPLAATIDRYVEAAGWALRLSAVVVSQREGTIKPERAMFEAAEHALARSPERMPPERVPPKRVPPERVPPERILHVGDDWIADVVGAREAGWHVGYLRNRQGDSPLPTSTPEAGIAPDFVIDRLSEVEAHVRLWEPGSVRERNRDGPAR
jgi:FMN phosphatase YigB (HAD superfamily)